MSFGDDRMPVGAREGKARGQLLGVSALRYWLPDALRDGGPKCITKAVITSGGTKRTPALSTSWGQTSPSLRLLSPPGIMGTHGL
jgi:hypothetical protein